MELALEVKCYLYCHWVTRPGRRTPTNGSDVKDVFPLTNGSDVKDVFPRCHTRWDLTSCCACMVKTIHRIKHRACERDLTNGDVVYVGPIVQRRSRERRRDLCREGAPDRGAQGPGAEPGGGEVSPDPATTGSGGAAQETRGPAVPAATPAQPAVQRAHTQRTPPRWATPRQ